MTSATTAYDSVLYPNHCFRQTHPDRLAVMGRLHGMTPVNIERCRVLELACGDGSNLIPMAYGLPGSEFVGVDLAAKPIERGRQRILRYGLSNIRVQQMDVMELVPGFGKFDYIIAHGLYAWVPEVVQEKILAICKANLNPEGIAFVSYNTNPPGYIREAIRRIVQFHAKRNGKQQDPVKSAREFGAAILKIANEESPWGALLRYEFEANFDRDDRVVFHDDLGECFSPVSFIDFAGRAGRNGLQVLSEAGFRAVIPTDVSEEGLRELSKLAGDDGIAYQHYLDFATYRRFRQTLLCHADVPLTKEGQLAKARELLVASPVKAGAEQPDGSVRFSAQGESLTMETNNPLLIGALRCMEHAWPHARKLGDLIEERLTQPPQQMHAEVRDAMTQAVLRLAADKFVNLQIHGFRVAASVTERPEASLIARREAEEGQMVTTLLHTNVRLEEDSARRFVQLLDGTHDKAALAEAVAPEFLDVSREAIGKHVEDRLATLHGLGLLVA